jgi:protein CpxP
MKIIVAALASTFFISGAYAQMPTQPVVVPSAAQSTPTAMMVKADAKRDAKVEQRIKDLHAKLKITQAQEMQWANVAKAMRDTTVEIDAAIDKRESHMDNATAIDDLNAYADIAQAHADSVKKLSATFTPLYAAMSDSQKKVADAVFVQHQHGEKHEAK